MVLLPLLIEHVSGELNRRAKKWASLDPPSFTKLKKTLEGTEGGRLHVCNQVEVYR
jgi:hypothetical protein